MPTRRILLFEDDRAKLRRVILFFTLMSTTAGITPNSHIQKKGIGWPSVVQHWPLHVTQNWTRRMPTRPMQTGVFF